MSRTGLHLAMVGEDGNAFAILGRAQRELRRGGYDREFAEQFVREATSEDYDHLLRTVMDYFNVDGEGQYEETFDDEYA